MKEGDNHAKTQEIPKIAEWLLRYGQIRYLGKGRRNPYGVYPPAVEEYDNGHKKTPPALCYVSDRMVGLAVLTSYKAGTYKPGDEILIEQQMRNAATNTEKLFDGLIADYNKAVLSIDNGNKPTFEDVFKRFYLYKFGAEYGHGGQRRGMERSLCSAYRNLSKLHQRVFSDLKTDDLQKEMDLVGERLSRSSAALIKTLYNQMYSYAEANDLCDKNYALYVKMNTADDTEHGIPFSESDLRKLWQHKSDPIVEFLLIMCYSGYRISAYRTLEVHLNEKYFKGGVKTAAGKERVVPIHSAILPLVRRRVKEQGKILTITPERFRDKMYDTLDELEIERHTPHDCRHTFSALCEKYGVNENDRKRMLGHSFGSDITNKIYGHRTVEELREQIEKIKVDLL